MKKVIMINNKPFCVSSVDVRAFLVLLPPMINRLVNKNLKDEEIFILYQMVLYQ